MSYVSPIEIIVGEFELHIEDGIVKIVRDVWFNVNKEEIEKAMLHDRGQYDKGYSDGKNENIKEVLETIDKVALKASAPYEFWTAEKIITVLRRDIEALKGGTGEIIE